MFWYLNRLRSMSFFEILFRFKQMIQKYYEKVFVMRRPPKMPKVSANGLPFKITGIEDFSITGVINIFGKEFNYYRNDIQWHNDIFSNNQFPLVFSKSINIRSQPNLSIKAVWEINRMQFLTLIALNYKLKGTENDLKIFIKIVDSWITHNPYLVGVNWYSNIEVNIRLIVWYYCWNILDVEELKKNHVGFKEFVETKWLPSIYQHCKYSYNNPSKFSSSNNHLISEYAGLYIASSLWKFPNSTNWNKYAKRGLEKEIIRQHSANGVNKEEAAEYIQFITDFFLLAYVVGQKSNNPFSNLYKERLKKIIYYINYILDIKGNFPKYGDEDDGKCIVFSEDHNFNNFKSILTSGVLLFNDSFLKSKSTEIDVKNLILFGDEAIKKVDQVEVAKGILKTKFYEEEGHFIFRHSVNDKEVFLHFNAAPLGFLSIAAHGHADALSFSLNIDGNPFFVDPGTYIYHTKYDWRKYFIGTLAHNTVRVNRKNQADIAGATLWLNHYNTTIINSKLSEEIDKVKAQHDGYRNKGIIHSREIVMEKSKNLIRIIDNIECKKEGKYFLEFPFHFHPNVFIKQNDSKKFQIMNQEGVSLELEIDIKLEAVVVKGQVNPQILGWYSKSFLLKEPSNTIYCTSTITHTQTFQSVILLT